MRRLLIIIALISVMLIQVYGDTTTGKFLNIVKGPAAGGVGEAFTAVDKEVESVYYNPAGLSGLQNTIISINYMRYGIGLNYESR